MTKRNQLNLLKKCLALTFTLTSLMQVKGQTLFFYFIAPNNVIASNFGAKLDSQYCPGGYSKALITASNAAKFNSVAPPKISYVYTQLQAGTALRTNINLVLKNSGGAVTQVLYFLVDDRTALTTTGIFTTTKDNGSTYVWPAAGSVEVPKNSKKFTGVVMLGEHQLDTDQSQRAGGMKAVDEVVLHETSHTQWTGNFSKWGVDGAPITYGADGQHYMSFSEMLGDQEGAMNEGLATFYGFVMNDDGLQKLMGLYNSVDHRYFVEAQSVLAGSSGLYSVKNRESNVLADAYGNTKMYDSGGAVNIYAYKWWDVPGFYLLFAESTSTAFFSIMRNHSYQNKDTMFDMIRHTSFAMSPDRKKRFLTYACNRLAIRMEQYNNSAIGQADGSRISSLFPFAVLDLITHFGMSDAEFQADYRRNNADANPKAYSEYFSRRAAIKALVQADITATPIKFSDALDKIKNYCRQGGNMF